MTNYLEEAKIAKKLDELFCKMEEPLSPSNIIKALKDAKKGPRHKAYVAANAEGWLLYLLAVLVTRDKLLEELAEDLCGEMDVHDRRKWLYRIEELGIKK